MSGINSLEYRLEQFIRNHCEQKRNELGFSNELQRITHETLAGKIAHEFGSELKVRSLIDPEAQP